MLAVLIFLGLPVLAGLLLVLDHYVRFNATRDELPLLSLFLRLAGLALAAAGLFVMVAAARGENAAPKDAFDVLVRIGAGTYGLLAILAAVVGNAFRRSRDTSALRVEARLEQRASLFRLLSWIVVLMPLLPFVPGFIFVVPLVLTTFLSSWGALNRGTQISLLWRLTIASENDLPYAPEVEAASIGAGRRRREELASLADRLRDGQTLEAALGDGSPLVPRGDLLSIRATDGTPALSETLRASANRAIARLADMRESGAALPTQAYIMNVMLVLMAIGAFLMYYIVPKYKEILNDFGVPMPPISRGLIKFSDEVLTHWYVMGPLACLPMVLLLLPPVIVLAGWENLNFPLLMRWFPRKDAPEILRILAAIVDSQRPLDASVAELASRHPREDLRSRLGRVASELESGNCSWSVLEHERFINRDEAAALDAAAGNNHLAWAMRSLADSIESRQRIRTDWILEWQRPVLIGGLGLAVGAFCLGMFMPLVTMIESLSREFP